MFIIIFQCITAGKAEVSEECFVQNDNTHFVSDIIFLPVLVLFKKLRKSRYMPTGWP